MLNLFAVVDILLFVKLKMNHFIVGAKIMGINNTEDQEKSLDCTEYYPNGIIDIKCGSSHTLVLTSNQNVFSCENVVILN